ncbi:lysine transporter LysE [Streptomyces sp. NPDC093089]|uniref:lysine transporter LysE n=1 Tax=Streptomyces sp. NPDC093089 TaxID=3366024 RepID=UPI00380E1E18
MVRGLWEFLKEAVAEIVGEALLGVLACLLLGGLLLLALWGWSVSPLLTGGGAGLFALFTGYGVWEAFRAPARRRTGRLAAAAVCTSGYVLVFAYYASGCSC